MEGRGKGVSCRVGEQFWPSLRFIRIFCALLLSSQLLLQDCNTKYLRNVFMYFTLHEILQKKGRWYTHVMMRNLKDLKATLLYRIH